jgi:hypothetical protein
MYKFYPRFHPIFAHVPLCPAFQWLRWQAAPQYLTPLHRAHTERTTDSDSSAWHAAQHRTAREAIPWVIWRVTSAVTCDLSERTLIASSGTL